MREMNLLKLSIFVLLAATLGYGQASRTWVSGVGDDANPCSRTAPCKTFAGAISKTANGGEIDALDPGGFGAVTITKAITLDGGGGQVASILVAGTSAIVVAAQTNDVVIIRNLRLDGLLGSANPGANGIRFLSGKALHIEKCTIFGFATHAIDIEVGSGAGNVFIQDTTAANNGNAGAVIFSSVATVANIVGSRFANNAVGIFAGNNSTFNIKDTDISGNTNGIQAQPSAGSATVRISNVSLFNNGNAYVTAGGGTISSFGNNYNSGSGTPNGTPILPQ